MKKEFKIKIWQILIAIIAIIVVFLFIKIYNSEHITNNSSLGEHVTNDNYLSEHITNNNPLIGKWVVVENQQLQDGNFFEFNDDNTFTYATSRKGIAKGTYTFDLKINTGADFKNTLKTGYIYYTVTLKPEEVELNDGRVLVNNLNKMEYYIGVNETEMVSINTISGNVTNLKLINQ